MPPAESIPSIEVRRARTLSYSRLMFANSGNCEPNCAQFIRGPRNSSECMLSHFISVPPPLTSFLIQLPEDARQVTILYLETLSGVAKGLTRTTDGPTLLEDDSDTEVQVETETIKRAREDPRAIKLREGVSAVIRGVMELWSADLAIGHVCLSTRIVMMKANILFSRP